MPEIVSAMAELLCSDRQMLPDPERPAMAKLPRFRPSLTRRLRRT
jgi:hypothetical protein